MQKCEIKISILQKLEDSGILDPEALQAKRSNLVLNEKMNFYIASSASLGRSSQTRLHEIFSNCSATLITPSFANESIFCGE